MKQNHKVYSGLGEATAKKLLASKEPQSLIEALEQDMVEEEGDGADEKTKSKKGKGKGAGAGGGNRKQKVKILGVSSPLRPPVQAVLRPRPRLLKRPKRRLVLGKSMRMH